MVIEDLSTLEIHKLTQEQYNRELEAGNINPNALYLTPESSIYVQNEEPLGAAEGSLWVDLDADSTDGSGTSADLSNYALKSDLPTKVSQLTNDSNFVTEAEISSYINNAILGGKW